MAPISATLVESFKLANSCDSSNLQTRRSSTAPTNTFTQRGHGHWSASHGTTTPSNAITTAHAPSTDPNITAGAIVAIVLAALVVGALFSVPIYIAGRHFFRQHRLRLLAGQLLIQPHQIRGWSASTNDTQRTPPPTYSQSQGGQAPMIETRTTLLPSTNNPTISITEHGPQQRNSASFAHNLAIFHTHIDEEAQSIREIEAEREKTLLMLEGHNLNNTPYVTHVADFAFDQFCKSMRISEPDTTPEKPLPVKLAAIKKAATAPELNSAGVHGNSSPGGSLNDIVAAANPLKTPEIARLRGPIHQTSTQGLLKLGEAYNP